MVLGWAGEGSGSVPVEPPKSPPDTCVHMMCLMIIFSYSGTHKLLHLQLQSLAGLLGG